MKINLFLTNPHVNIPINNQKEVNSFIHRLLGKDNKYHDRFSNYAISSLQGGKLNSEGNLTFEKEPYIIISSNDMEFIDTMLEGIQEKNEKLFDMSHKRVTITEYNVNEYYDNVITISPILLKDKEGRKITFKNDKWLNTLILNCKMKLLHEGIEDSTFNIKIKNPENGKEKLIYVGDVFNPASMVRLVVYGKEKTRRTLYNLGLGHSTGSGFGSISIMENKNENE